MFSSRKHIYCCKNERAYERGEEEEHLIRKECINKENLYRLLLEMSRDQMGKVS